MCRTPATRRSNRNSLAEIVECAKSVGACCWLSVKQAFFGLAWCPRA